MSRYEVTPLLPKLYQVYVGWEGADQSYYYFVMRHLRTGGGEAVGLSDGHVVRDGGTCGREPIETVECLRAALSEYAELPPYVADLLEDDREREQARGRGGSMTAPR